MAQRADGMLNKVYLTESRLNRASTRPRLHSRFVPPVLPPSPSPSPSLTPERVFEPPNVSEGGVHLAATTVHNYIANCDRRTPTRAHQTYLVNRNYVIIRNEIDIFHHFPLLEIFNVDTS